MSITDCNCVGTLIQTSKTSSSSDPRLCRRKIRDRERVPRYERQSIPKTIFEVSEHPKVLRKRLVSGFTCCKTRNEHLFVDRTVVTVNTKRNQVFLHVSVQLYLHTFVGHHGIGRPGKNNVCPPGSDSVCSQHINSWMSNTLHDHPCYVPPPPSCVVSPITFVSLPKEIFEHFLTSDMPIVTTRFGLSPRF